MFRQLFEAESRNRFFLFADDFTSDQDKKGKKMVVNVETGGLIDYDKFMKKPSQEDGYLMSRNEAQKHLKSKDFSDFEIGSLYDV